MKVADVTAGGSGMGAAAARKLAPDGCKSCRPRRSAGSVPMQRYGTSDEIAATIAFLASEGAAYITGQNLRVDGRLMRSI